MPRGGALCYGTQFVLPAAEEIAASTAAAKNAPTRLVKSVTNVFATTREKGDDYRSRRLLVLRPLPVMPAPSSVQLDQPPAIAFTTFQRSTTTWLDGDRETSLNRKGFRQGVGVRDGCRRNLGLRIDMASLVTSRRQSAGNEFGRYDPNGIKSSGALRRVRSGIQVSVPKPAAH